MKDSLKNLAMLDVAETLLKENNKPMSIDILIKKVSEIKGIDAEDYDKLTQLYMDITQSAKFVYSGNDEWDLKERNLELWDKDGYAFVTAAEIEEAEEEEDDLEFTEFVFEEKEETPEEKDDEEDEDDEDDEEIADEIERKKKAEEEKERKEEEAYIDVELPIKSTDDDDVDDDIDLEFDEYDEDDYNEIMDDYEDMYEDD